MSDRTSSLLRMAHSNETNIGRRHPHAGSVPRLLPRSAASASGTAYGWVPWLICVMVMATSLSVLIVSRNAIFDDSFISYRYARHLSQGWGLVWNRGEAPVEGYTNPLLVCVLAIFMRFGGEPLLVTRILGCLAAVGLCLLLERYAISRYGAKRTSAVSVGALFLAVGPTMSLVSLGMETVLYASCLLFAFVLLLDLTQKPSVIVILGFPIALFAAFLFRPEALLLLVPTTLVGVTGPYQHLKNVLLSLLLFFLMLGSYLVWKLSYFGDILPNPFYIKAASPALVSPLGLDSVATFVQKQWKLIALAGAALVVARPVRKETWLACALVLVNALFFVHVDTLMDAESRFLYPMLPLLYLIALPLTLSIIEKAGALRPMAAALVALVVLVAAVYYPRPRSSAAIVYHALQLRDHFADPQKLMKREALAAAALREYPGIGKLKLALGDVGIIPYQTQCTCLDLVGLNDRYIARERDHAKLVAYVFRQKPDIVFVPSRNHRWLEDDHGPLGDYTSWMNDDRWRRYEYVGFIHFRDIYDYQVFCLKTAPNQAQLKRFLQERVLDGAPSRCPVPYGSGVPSAASSSRVPDAMSFLNARRFATSSPLSRAWHA